MTANVMGYAPYDLTPDQFAEFRSGVVGQRLRCGDEWHTVSELVRAYKGREDDGLLRSLAFDVLDEDGNPWYAEFEITYAAPFRANAVLVGRAGAGPEEAG